MTEDSAIADRSRRLAAYADAYVLRVAEVISQDFCGLRAVFASEADYLAAIRAYLAAFPSHSPNIAEIGRHLPEFLSAYGLSRELPFLPDLGRLEWALAEVYFAADLPALDIAALASREPEAWTGARFELDSSVQLLELSWPVLRYQRLAHSGRMVCAPPTRPRTERVLVFRDPSGESRAKRLTAACYQTLTRLLAGATLGEVSGQLEREKGSAASAQIQGWFQSWVSDGIVRKVVFP